MDVCKRLHTSTKVDIRKYHELWIGVKAYIGEQDCIIFYVQDDGMLIFRSKETNFFSFCLHKEVRVLQMMDQIGS